LLAVKRISEGAFSPLLFISTRLVAGLLAFGLVGCSFHKTPPLFTASGYVSDEGINRVWRLDDAEHHPMTVLVVTRRLAKKSKLLLLKYLRSFLVKL